MLRYRLDDLGWFHFEKLVQSLLKAELGLAVQSWGGHSDLGRDAYAQAALPFPDRSRLTAGPFTFQVKLVQGANATGSKWRPLLSKAVAAECKRIAQRRTNASWQEPKQYVLLTNCPLTRAAKEALHRNLKRALPEADITLLGGTDICDLLDNNPDLRRSFPEILSLRDLDLLLSEAVSRPILERSRAAVEESRDLVPVFVPTHAYHQAWKSIQKHSFVVPDGPPEMGKTAIARTIALGHLINDWQAIDCRDPSDLFSVLCGQTKQVFVADDAFGRTEYDPVLGRMWERDLPRVFHCLDSRHRLIWTTRKHILMRALREMDLTGRASRFPEPGEVIVTAGDLTVEEKARILYRHSRAARLDPEWRALVRDNAAGIVKHEHFTPERVRRFVRDHLPDLASRTSYRAVSRDQIDAEIREAIRDPTDRMRKSFRKLHANHRWILIAFLECNEAVQSDVLRQRFVAHRGTASDSAFDEALDDLIGTFLKHGYGRNRWQGKRLDWIHPSYRDLVIDELSNDLEEQTTFLKHVSTAGIKLALSRAGGRSGERELPLIRGDQSREVLERRCREIANGDDSDSVSQLLDSVSNALQIDEPPSSADRPWLSVILRSICNIAVRRWNESGDPIALNVLESYYRASGRLDPRPTQPQVEPTWEVLTEEIREQIGSSQVDDPSRVKGWFDLAEIIEDRYRSFAVTTEFRWAREEIESQLFELAAEQVHHGAQLEDPEHNEAEGCHIEELAEVLSTLDRYGTRSDVISGLYRLAAEYKENGPVEDEEDYQRPEADVSGADFDIDALFEDL